MRKYLIVLVMCLVGCESVIKQEEAKELVPVGAERISDGAFNEHSGYVVKEEETILNESDDTINLSKHLPIGKRLIAVCADEEGNIVTPVNLKVLTKVGASEPMKDSWIEFVAKVLAVNMVWYLMVKMGRFLNRTPDGT